MKAYLELEIAQGDDNASQLAEAVGHAGQFLAQRFAGTRLCDGDTFDIPAGRLRISAFHARNGGPCYTLAQIRHGSGFRRDARFTAVCDPVE